MTLLPNDCAEEKVDTTKKRRVERSRKYVEINR